MAQIINDPWATLAGGYGSTIGQGMGQGLSQTLGAGIQQLAQNKLQGILQRQQEHKLQQAGIHPQLATLLSQTPPEQQPRVLQSWAQYMQPMPGTTNEPSQIMQNQQIPVEQNQQVLPPQQIDQQKQLQQAQVIKQKQQPRTKQDIQLQKQVLPKMKNLSPQDQQILQSIELSKSLAAQKLGEDKTPPVLQQQIPKPSIKEPSVSKAPKKTLAEEILPAEVIQSISPSPIEVAKSQKPPSPTPGLPMKEYIKERNEFRKEQAKNLAEARKEQHYIDKQTKPYVEELDKKGGRGSKIAEDTLNRMEKLIDTGKLTGATIYNLRSKLESSGHLVGGGIGTALGAVGGALLGSIVPGLGTIGGATTGAGIGGGLGAAAGGVLTPKFVGTKEDQEFTKLSRYFLQGMKDLFGARVTQQEVAIFLDSIPTLSLTDEGKKAVIRDMRLISSGWKHKKQVKDAIIEANNGFVPANIETLVDKAAAPKLDDLSKKFASGTELSMNV